MNLKKILFLIFSSISLFLFAQEPIKYKFYGFIRSDFHYNSRQNVEAIDGLFHLFPKPIEIDLLTNEDVNAIPQSEMLSIATRFGFDITGADILGAKSSAKIETDFAGFASNFYVLRIRHAYTKLNWIKSELLVGQTWHPLFGSVMPTIPSLNTGSPFQPFNRSPQIRFKYNLKKTFSVLVAASYQMQYTSQGPFGASAVYLKNAMLPDMFLGTECKTEHWTTGVGIDAKIIKPSKEKLSSVSVVAYTQFINTKFQFKVKSILGQNLTDYVVPCGYGVSDTTATGTPKSFTNLNMISTWMNAVYGKKFQIGIFLGYSQNLGASQALISKNGKYQLMVMAFITK